MSNPFIVLRRNWKKVAFISLVGPYGIYRLHNYTLDKQMMTYHCFKAQEYGDEKLILNSQPRHVTVILNPIAGKRKAKKYYTKFVEPLLHLAGIKVSLIETESPGQASDVMKIMSNCDCVAIVGGDGTVHEVLNGLLSRPDAASAAKAFPIAIIPAGIKNTLAEHIHKSLLQTSYKEFLMTSTMSLVYGNAHKFDILNIKPIGNVQESPRYSLKGLKYGVYQDFPTKVSMFLPGSLYIKQIWYKFMRLIRPEKYSYTRIERLEVTEPCIGCSRCIKSHRLSNTMDDKDKNIPAKRWWASLVPMARKSTQTEEEKAELLLEKRDNVNCNVWRNIEAHNISNIEATTIGDQTIRLSIHRDDDYLPSDQVDVQNVRLHVENRNSSEPNEEQGQEVSAGNIKGSSELQKDKLDIEDKNPKFIVDGEPTGCVPVELSSLRKTVTIFTGPLDS